MEDLEGINMLLYTFHESRGTYPTTGEGLAIFTDPARIPDIARVFPGFGPSRIVDPWGHLYRYRAPGVRNPGTYDLSCLGPDGIEDTDDDIIDR